MTSYRTIIGHRRIQSKDFLSFEAHTLPLVSDSVVEVLQHTAWSDGEQCHLLHALHSAAEALRVNLMAASNE